MSTNSYILAPMTQGQRIKKLRTEGDLTQAGLARMLGITRNAVLQWEKDKNHPSGKNLRGLASMFDREIEWITHGKKPRRADTDGDFAMVDHYDMAASAGSGRLVVEERVKGQLAFRREWLRTIGVSPDRAALIQVVGDSMAPTINDGDTILIDTDDTSVRGENIYVGGHDNDLFVKHVKRLMGGLLLSSVNRAYPDITFSAEEAEGVQIIGRARWVGHQI